MSDFDAIIIGTGQAGPSLAFRLAGAGMKVAVVERRLVGGTCVNTGCTPTKALVASAYAARIARRAAEYGVLIGGDIGIDMRQVKARKDAIVAASRNGLTSALENAANITLYRGHAVRVTASGGNRRPAAARRKDLYQCRRPGAGAANARHK
jgi:pyruvate/2-oxoglutarate dehydrogenase complex dihydrolipoamide dehydrogenase (E3) component